MSRAFESEGGDFEFNPEMGEFDEAEYGEAEFDEAEFDEAEFDEAEVRDHRRRLPPPPPHGYPQRPYASRAARPPLRYPRSGQPSRYYAARPYASRPYASRPYGSRPYGATPRWQWPARPVYGSQYSGAQQPVRYGYWQQPYAAGVAPRWRRWRRWPVGGWPYGQARNQQAQPYDEPQYPEPAYTEPPPPPLPPPVPMVQMAPPPVAEPPAPTEPPAPPPTGQQGAGELYIEPEAFEFEPEYGYEGEQDEYAGGYGEYEAGPQQRYAEPCPPYLPGEVAKSKTAAGHLPSDFIENHPRGSLVCDFGVDWRHTKPGLERDAALRAWLAAQIAYLKTHPGEGLVIFGYSDCVGPEANNMFLRRGRAQRVKSLLLRLAGADASFLRSRLHADAAGPGDYVSSNATVDGRAQNRGALVTLAFLVTGSAPRRGSRPGP